MLQKKRIRKGLPRIGYCMEEAQRENKELNAKLSSVSYLTKRWDLIVNMKVIESGAYDHKILKLIIRRNGFREHSNTRVLDFRKQMWGIKQEDVFESKRVDNSWEIIR